MIKSKEPYYHICYWCFVVLVLTYSFGLSWGNKAIAFLFVCMLLPIVLGTSYFFNYFLVPNFFFKKRYKRFAFYTFCTAVVSGYLEMMTLVFFYAVMVNFDYESVSPLTNRLSVLPLTMYMIVLIGSFFLMMKQINENQHIIRTLEEEKEKRRSTFLEIMSNRKMVKIPYHEIIYIESLSERIKITSINQEIVSNERISKLSQRLPDEFLRIHRSFVINTNRIKEHSSDEIFVDDTRFTIGRSYRKEVKEVLNAK